MILREVVKGIATGALVTVLWMTAFGRPPALIELLLASYALTFTWSRIRDARLRNQWQGVLDSYHQPALGQGIDIPHRPPTD
ncbi:hypothetical protein [Streptomyces capuensis]|uniref:hypothetical protein n=1 Tax=Streptomyces capuensis TaxID=1464056 RepID=UPI0004C11A1F|nr:hypothetical protein [Streptomyces capuensis]